MGEAALGPLRRASSREGARLTTKTSRPGPFGAAPRPRNCQTRRTSSVPILQLASLSSGSDQADGLQHATQGAVKRRASSSRLPSLDATLDRPLRHAAEACLAIGPCREARGPRSSSLRYASCTTSRRNPCQKRHVRCEKAICGAESGEKRFNLHRATRRSHFWVSRDARASLGVRPKPKPRKSADGQERCQKRPTCLLTPAS